MGIYNTVIVARTRTISWPSWRPSTGTEPRRGGTDQKGGRRAQRTPPPPPPLPPPPTGNRTFHQQSWLDFGRLQLKKIYSCRLVGSGFKKVYLPGSYLLRLQLQKTIFFSFGCGTLYTRLSRTVFKSSLLPKFKNAGKL